MALQVRLKQKDPSITELFLISLEYYKRVDNKRDRAKLDVVSAKLIARKNLTYDYTTKQWQQSGREIRFDFLVKSDPVSYEKKDDISPHQYPVIFLIRDLDKGMNSSFRSRVGGLKRWKSPKLKVSEGKTPAEKERRRKINQQILEINLRNGLQADFIFRNMWVWKQYGLLFGPMTCLNRPPKITNPQMWPYFSKHEYWIIWKLLEPILTTKKNIIKEKLFKNEEKIGEQG